MFGEKALPGIGGGGGGACGIAVVLFLMIGRRLVGRVKE